ncbi:putative dihydroorotate oxidase [Mycobacterium xenopi 3993]|nr:putative dihydroorotate oxidase [Mycobacterium xenopi 3993]
MGFNNAGAGQLAIRLAHHRADVPIGSTSAKPRPPRPQTPPRTIGPAHAWWARWRRIWWSMSARPTRRA